MVIHRWNAFTRLAIAGLICLAPACMWAQDAKQPQCKDQAECDLYNSILQDNNPKTKLEKLQQWEQKYPTTDFAKVRRTLLLTTYAAAGQSKEAVGVAKQTLAEDPKDFNALYYTMFLTRGLYGANQQASVLDDGEKAAQALLATIDTPPAGVTADQWKQLRPDIELLSHITLGFAGMQRKNWDAAEAELKKTLALNPNNSEVDYMMAFTQASKKNNSAALYYYARAAAYDGPGALAAAGRQQVMGEVQRMYNGYHGSAEGFNELLAAAKANPNPPDGFKIKSKSEIAKEKYEAESANEEKFTKEHPEWALWKKLREALTGADGANYFESGMKGASVGPFKVKVVSMQPALKPKALMVQIEEGTEADPPVANATLKFETALAGKVEPGTELTFEGVPDSFTATPLMVVFNVEKEKLQGWTGKNTPGAAAPVHKGPAPKAKAPVKK